MGYAFTIHRQRKTIEIARGEGGAHDYKHTAAMGFWGDASQEIFGTIRPFPRPLLDQLSHYSDKNMHLLQ